MYSSTIADDRHAADRPPAVEHLDHDRSPTPARRALRPASATAPGRPAAGARGAVSTSTTRFSSGCATRPWTETIRERCAERSRAGTARVGSACMHAGQPRDLVERAARRRQHEVHGHVLPLDDEELLRPSARRSSRGRTSRGSACATAAAMPSTDVAARTGWPPTLRRIMRTGADSSRCQPGALEPAASGSAPAAPAASPRPAAARRPGGPR